ncbi:Syf2p ASCRUDRAFT_7570 [Ascoidea rubescens DSM 1968]|uniref:Pre-mRNA-splicing factor SYF2 n=1 Tax=Ascoidea rubescens DSM 1968 TaxID=1344418 RepID=A0A1D2VI48_9ASCO|nr:hypothetical protein ASCRUDRAFT_7570 [Ascoidea rubescens DSM 1968]ODV61321.1 hypothetical protein ASCRUDRAFT_7570 [Ascoidea rubescens DSM 1968]
MSARERFQKLRELKIKKNYTLIENKKELIKEYKRNRITKNNKTNKTKKSSSNQNHNGLNILKLKAEKELIELNLFTNEKNKNEYEKRKLLNYSIEDHENWTCNQKLKDENASNNFKLQNYNQLALQTYLKDVKKISLADSNSISALQGETTSDLLDGLSKNLISEDQRRMDSKRRKAEKESDNTFFTYINRKNKEFNQKLARDYAPYTKQTKDNFERGTAL